MDAIVGVRLDGQELWRVEAARPESPAISPDGTQVAFAASDELQVYDISSRALRVLGLRGHHPAWAHDATRLAYDDGRQVYVYDFRTQKTSIAGPGTDPSWSTDGVTLAVRASFNEVDMINTRDRRRQALLQKREVRMPQWSPDGEWMAYSYLGQGSLFPLTIEPHPIVIRNVQTGDEVEVDSYSKAFPGDYVWIRNVDLCAA